MHQPPVHVGIGTSTPTNDLSLGGDVARTIQVEAHSGNNATGSDLTVKAGSGVGPGGTHNGGNLILSSGDGFGTGTSAMTFSTATSGASTEKMRIQANAVTIGGPTNNGAATNTAVTINGTGPNFITTSSNTNPTNLTLNDAAGNPIKPSVGTMVIVQFTANFTASNGFQINGIPATAATIKKASNMGNIANVTLTAFPIQLLIYDGTQWVNPGQ